MANMIEIDETDIEAPLLPQKPKSGVGYILLAWFLGIFGAHDFYAGNFFSGLLKLVLTLVSWLFLFIPLLITMIWSFLDMLFVNKDACGIPFSGNREVILLLRIVAAVWLLGSIYYLYDNAQFSYEETEMVAPGQEVSVEMTN